MDVLVSIIIYRGQAFLATYEHIEGGGHTANDPVFTTNLDVASLAETIDNMYQRGNPEVPRLGVEQLRNRRDPLLRATKANSWTEMARKGATYTLDWYEDSVEYFASTVDTKGRWVDDPAKTRKLPADTSIVELSEMILDDWKSRGL